MNLWQLLESFGKFVEASLLKTALISPEDMSLFTITDNVDAAVEHTLNFYRVYHSMRYVNNYLVLRICQQLRLGSSSRSTSRLPTSSSVAPLNNWKLCARRATNLNWRICRACVCISIVGDWAACVN